VFGLAGHLFESLVAAAVLAASDRNPAASVVIVPVVGAAGLWYGIRFWRRRWVIVDTPTSECAGVFVGRNEVVGTAHPHAMLTAPVTGQSCVWFKWDLERWVQRQKSGSWQTIEARSSNAPFWVVDETGGVLVRPRKAEVHARQVFQERAHASGVMASHNDLHLASFQGEDRFERERSASDSGFARQGSQEPIASRGRNIRITEWRIDAGQPLYILGTAAMRPDVVALEFDQRHGSDGLVISTHSESRMANRALLAAFGGLLVGLAAVVLFPAAVHATRTYESAGAVPGSPSTLEAVGSWMLTASLAYLGVLILVYWQRVYNRLVAVKQQAANAWSLIDVALRRRHDLLPNLVAVAKRYTQHEQEVLTAVAGVRMGEALPAPEVLPSDRLLVQAGALNQAERGGSRSLVALAEAYPQLKADEVFQDLARRMTEAENQVAYARAFYNDAVTVLRDRRRTFPGLLLARLVVTPSWNLFDADDQETYVPPVDLAPSTAAPPS
jgi:LemA protein